VLAVLAGVSEETYGAYGCAVGCDQFDLSIRFTKILHPFKYIAFTLTGVQVSGLKKQSKVTKPAAPVHSPKRPPPAGAVAAPKSLKKKKAKKGSSPAGGDEPVEVKAVQRRPDWGTLETDTMLEIYAAKLPVWHLLVNKPTVAQKFAQ
jgi:hypothetical protein